MRCLKNSKNFLKVKKFKKNLKESNLKNCPYIFKDILKKELIKLKEGRINFKTLKENIKKNFEVFKKLEEFSES